MSVRIKLKGYDIIVLPFEGKVLGQLRTDGTRIEIAISKNKAGYHRLGSRMYGEQLRSRLIWSAVNGPIPKGLQINHINHNTSDDRITNLELVTPQQNQAYKKKRKKSSNLYKGVWQSSNKTRRPFVAQIGCGVSNKSVYIGSFATAEEAALAYDAAAREWFGRHAVLNFPDT